MLIIGGLTPFTTIDFPGKLAAVIFCQGCPWRCGYCHNRHLLDAGQPGTVPWHEVIRFLEQRRGLLDAVVFSGGEPTLQTRLPDAVAAVRRMGFLTGLHTGGPYPERLAACLPHLDWVGMDLKAPFELYDEITCVKGSGKAAEQSTELVRLSGVAHQFRTTVDPFLRVEGRLERLQQMVEGWGEQLVLQELRIGAAPVSEVFC
ncbi:MAG: anaerobic ribonucleoside-triphosphate reductase activating protein [Geobacter sp.]|nr:anaerobic ribonucleoside-triphosphate reductase activating protein [Geobacter sp.]